MNKLLLETNATNIPIKCFYLFAFFIESNSMEWLTDRKNHRRRMDLDIYFFYINTKAIWRIHWIGFYSFRVKFLINLMKENYHFILNLLINWSKLSFSDSWFLSSHFALFHIIGYRIKLMDNITNFTSFFSLIFE